MTRPKKTEAQLSSMREQILDTAFDILQEQGPYALTSRAIAERMQVSHMSLYTYFTNQAAILHALRNREMAKWYARQEIFEQRAVSEDIEQVVRDMLEFAMAFARETPNLYHMAWVMPEVGGESPEENRQRLQSTVGCLARLLKIGMERGAFSQRSPLLAAATVLGMINTPYILFYSGKLVLPDMRDRMVAEMLFAALHYLKSPPA
jgi:AcrR family transcriptional regulator